MSRCHVTFLPLKKAVEVEPGTTLLEAAGKAGIVINSVCGGDGICGRCKMVVKKGQVSAETTALLTREEIRRGMVLACQSRVRTDVTIEIPEETRAAEKIKVDEDAQRFRAALPGIPEKRFRKSPLVSKVFLQIAEPTLENNLADCQRVQAAIGKAAGVSSMQAGLKIVRCLPEILRQNGFAVTATVGMRRDIAEVMDIEGGDSSGRNYLAVADVGTTTVVVHLVDAVNMKTVGAQACFSSQSVYGREVTARIMAAEKNGYKKLQEVLVDDINGLISMLAEEHRVNSRDITGLVCSGNTTMIHFLLGVPVRNIRRTPYVAATVEPPPFRAAEVGIKINPRGLLFCVPGLSGWVGGDLMAGVLATGLYEMDKIGMLIDIGTNGEIIVGNKDWLMACSSSTGPALEGASVGCGMVAEKGAIERVFLENGRMRWKVIGDGPPRGLCGSGIIDLIAALLDVGALDRAGKLVEGSHPCVKREGGRTTFLLTTNNEAGTVIRLTQEDIENIVTAKAAVFAAMKIMLDRLDLTFPDIDKLFIAGGFGNYINRRSAVQIGLLPDLPISRIEYVGNTSIWGATLVALSREAYETVREIRQRTTYYDLMGAADYVEEFQRAMFLPHTDIELFPSIHGYESAVGR